MMKLYRAALSACLIAPTFFASHSAVALTYEETACVSQAFLEGWDPSKCFGLGGSGGSAGSGGSGSSGSASSAPSNEAGGGLIHQSDTCPTPDWFPTEVEKHVPGSFNIWAERVGANFINAQNFLSKPSSKLSTKPQVIYAIVREYDASTVTFTWTEFDTDWTGTPNIVNKISCDEWMHE